MGMRCTGVARLVPKKKAKLAARLGGKAPTAPLEKANNPAPPADDLEFINSLKK